MSPEMFLNNIQISGWIFNILLKAIFVSMAGWAAIRMLKKASAPVRSAVTLAAMIFLLLLPFCFAASPVYDGLEFSTTISIAAGQPFTGGAIKPGIGSIIGKLNIVNIVAFFGIVWLCGFVVRLFLLFFRLSYIAGFKSGLVKIEGERLEHLIKRVAPAANDVTKRYSSQKKSSHKDKISTNSSIESERHGRDYMIKLGSQLAGIANLKTFPL